MTSDQLSKVLVELIRDQGYRVKFGTGEDDGAGNDGATTDSNPEHQWTTFGAEHPTPDTVAHELTHILLARWDYQLRADLDPTSGWAALLGAPAPGQGIVETTAALSAKSVVQAFGLVDDYDTDHYVYQWSHQGGAISDPDSIVARATKAANWASGRIVSLVNQKMDTA